MPTMTILPHYYVCNSVITESVGSCKMRNEKLERHSNKKGKESKTSRDNPY